MDKALIAMSGGVDSSAAALLMRNAGFDCLGVTMKLRDSESYSEKACCTASDAEDARGVCARLGIPYYVFNFTVDFHKNVIENFVHSYEIGETPNPCIDCNRHLKFGSLYRKAAELGCRYIVTGHYARVEFDEKLNRWLLKKSLNAAKDQSYVLYFLSQEQLSHTKFPLGEFSDKAEVRRLAEENGLINAAKRESQDVCFIPDGSYASFIRQYRGADYPEGDFVAPDGSVLGRHKGVINYTIGQRKGLGISYSEPLYVLKKSVSDNTVTLGTERELYSDSLTARGFNWIMYAEPPAEPVRVAVRTRYHAKEAPATASANADGTVTVRFDEPQRAISAGQAVVLYSGDAVVGGGTIC
ncbi:MAG: tRNA 2-thiouridine(34) synthase MnmA [Lachnospiraceae bacterium]|nr:tRNA 2-thiouridine(34) synthase MnmA [Ruminococcus sp.]MCM1275672.1 tRNA 2-thiouridine(34) synthase MnmA [Lachnospiraceae bacterium]